MAPSVRSERGIALIVAILAILVVGGLVFSVASSAVFEHREAQSVRPMLQAAAVAEQGIDETLAAWNGGVFNALGVDETAPLSGTAVVGGGTYSGTVRRLNQELFLLEVTTSSTGARQRVGAIAKLWRLNLQPTAGLTTRGNVRRQGQNATISGFDTPPPNWPGCPPTQAPLAGISVPDASLVDPGNCSTCIQGNPQIQEDTTITASSFTDFGDLDWNTLVSLATKTGFTLTNPRIEPSVLGGQCDTTDPENWGDPANPTGVCGRYFPLIYAPGNLRIQQGAGQGILLVDGDLTINGTFEFSGVVIVQGVLDTSGGGQGTHFRGAVMAANATLQQTSDLTGRASIEFSSCALAKAQQGAASGARLRSRSWFTIY